MRSKKVDGADKKQRCKANGSCQKCFNSFNGQTHSIFGVYVGGLQGSKLLRVLSF